MKMRQDWISELRPWSRVKYRKAGGRKGRVPGDQNLKPGEWMVQKGWAGVRPLEKGESRDWGPKGGK